MVYPPLELGEGPLSAESFVTYYKISLMPRIPMAPTKFILESSPVLNLWFSLHPTLDQSLYVTDLSGDAVEEISNNLRRLLADVFALYVKTKNFHWHMSGRHFRDYHLLLDEQATQIFAMTDDIAERARKIGGTTIRSISDVAKNQRLKDNNKESVAPLEMISELCDDNQQLTRSLRATHEVCDHHNDVATASLIEVWIDEGERRTWFLAEIIHDI
jgi:starvation-inducible DNA-binding protein